MKISIILFLVFYAFSGFTSSFEQTDEVDQNSLIYKAACANDSNAQLAYARICYNDQMHPFNEAATFYWLSARNNNADALTYLSGLDNSLTFEDNYFDHEVNIIVTHWSKYPTFEALVKKNEDKEKDEDEKIRLIDYDKLNKTIEAKKEISLDGYQKNKLPDFYDACLHALFFIRNQDENGNITFSYNKSAFDRSTQFLSKNPEPYRWGAKFYDTVNMTIEEDLKSQNIISEDKHNQYQYNISKSLSQLSKSSSLKASPTQKKSKRKNTLALSDDAPYIHLLLTNAFIEGITNKSDGNIFSKDILIDLNHKSYAWIRAAIKFAEIDAGNTGHKLDVKKLIPSTNTKFEEIVPKLQLLEFIDNDILSKTVLYLETNNSFPNKTNEQYRDIQNIDQNNSIKEIEDQFKAHRLQYLCHSSSVETDLCKDVLKHLLLNIRTLEIDFSKDNYKDKLNYPLLLVHLQKLYLVNLTTYQKNIDALSQAGRWFNSLKELHIYYSTTTKNNKTKTPKYNKKSNLHIKFEELFNKIKDEASEDFILKFHDKEIFEESLSKTNDEF